MQLRRSILLPAAVCATLLGCGRCGNSDLPDIEVRGATEALSFEHWQWATEDRRQLVADIDFDGTRIHDVLCVFYEEDERLAVDGIPGNRFDAAGQFRRRFPIQRVRTGNTPDISETTKLVIHVNRTEEDAHAAVREHELVPEDAEAPARTLPSRP